MPTLRDLSTPSLVADRGRLSANANRMRQRAADHGVQLRPHLKTTKAAEVARIAHGGKIGPITVSTLREAEFFFEAGFRDITYAVCITPNKFVRAFDLIERGAELKLLLDHSTTAAALIDYAHGRRRAPGVFVEIDCGDHRTGVAPASTALIDVASMVAQADGLDFLGLLTHGGHSYAARSRKGIARVAEEERSALLLGQRRLADAGLDAQVLSSGSTPTAVFGDDFSGLSELRPGVYLAGDLFQAGLKTCEIEDIAVSVVASVIAHSPERNELVIDAGGLALSKDRSTAASPVDFGYGLVVRDTGERFDTDLVVQAVSQEHGQVTSAGPLPYDAIPVGSLVRVLPNHVCMTAASYDRYFVVEDGIRIVDEWEKATGW